jgi:SNF2 family DNA or RNA helicase
MELNQVVVQRQKLQQIACGFIYDENHVPVYLKSKKLKLLKEMLHDPDYLGRKKKVVVWGSYTGQLEEVGRSLDQWGISYCPYFGSMSANAKRHSRRSFANESGIRVFLGQVDRGVGMNELKVADTAIYLSNSTKVVSRQQSMRRIRRMGSEVHRVITYWDFITEGTLDAHILKTVKGKMSFDQSILDGIRHGVPIRKLFT